MMKIHNISSFVKGLGILTLAIGGTAIAGIDSLRSVIVTILLIFLGGGSLISSFSEKEIEKDKEVHQIEMMIGNKVFQIMMWICGVSLVVAIIANHFVDSDHLLGMIMALGFIWGIVLYVYLGVYIYYWRKFKKMN